MRNPERRLTVEVSNPGRGWYHPRPMAATPAPPTVPGPEAVGGPLWPVCLSRRDVLPSPYQRRSIESLWCPGRLPWNVQTTLPKLAGGGTANLLSPPRATLRPPDTERRSPAGSARVRDARGHHAGRGAGSGPGRPGLLAQPGGGEVARALTLKRPGPIPGASPGRDSRTRSGLLHELLRPSDLPESGVDGVLQPLE